MSPASERVSLPIDRFLPSILSGLETSRSLVLQASPGSGKTTRVPPFLLNRPHTGEILVLEPRRVAAKYAARRVASEMGVKLGEEVGYQFRFENVSSSKTRLRFLTEGMLMRRLLGDPLLRGIGTVIIDEFHERHIHGDVALAYLKKLQKGSRPDLEVIVMSATLDAEPVARFLETQAVIKIDAPIFPVETEYLKSPSTKYLDSLVRDAVTQAVDEEKGDILVFLPGMAEIRRASEALRELADSKRLLVTPLHGELSREEQDQAIEKGSVRKVILSTNLAETSLTIEGVSVVIDSGLHRQASYSWWSGIPKLQTRPISRASAIQRAGRAGRTGPGKCYRLYTRGDFDSRAAFDTPEIQRVDLAQTILELKALGVQNLGEFPWFESPAPQSLRGSEDLLVQLGALHSKNGSTELTESGRAMAQIPAHPRLARILSVAHDTGASVENAALFAAIISEGDSSGRDLGVGVKDALTVLADYRRTGIPEVLRKQVKLLLSSVRAQSSSGSNNDSLLRFAILAGFPDRVVKKRAPLGTSIQTEVELLFATGGSIKAQNTGVIGESDYFTVLDIQEKKSLGQTRAQLFLKSVIAIDPSWLIDLPQALLVETEEVVWDPLRKRVEHVSQMKYGQLVLSESKNAVIDPHSPIAAKAAALLLKSTIGVDLTIGASLAERIQSLRSLVDVEAFEEAWVRLQLFRGSQGKTELSVKDLDLFLSASMAGKYSLGDLEQDWTTALFIFFHPEDSARIDQMVPLHFELPNKKRAKINYKAGLAPWIESRLQDFFGVKTPPSIAQGKLRLTLHLLAPNHRALQVTTDLPGFWVRTYPEVRKELSRKYPRHSWPEDPLIAEPVVWQPRRPK
jgi:ATP-dependent helicase HrpB